MLANQRRPPGKPPWRIAEDRRLAWIGEAATDLRMLDLFPKATIMQVRIIEQVFRSTHHAPGETAFLGGMIRFFRRQTGNEVGNHVVDNVRRALCYDSRILILWIL